MKTWYPTFKSLKPRFNWLKNILHNTFKLSLNFLHTNTNIVNSWAKKKYIIQNHKCMIYNQILIQFITIQPGAVTTWVFSNQQAMQVMSHSKNNYHNNKPAYTRNFLWSAKGSTSGTSNHCGSIYFCGQIFSWFCRIQLLCRNSWICNFNKIVSKMI